MAGMELNNGPGTRVIMSPQAISRVEPMVIADLTRRAQKVQDAAVRQIRLGHIHAGQTGRKPLRDSIVKRIMPTTAGGPTIRIGTDNPIALIHHEGTRPHIIRPVRAKALVFAGSGGGLVYSKLVHHPGTKPNRFLTDNLHLATQ